MWKGSPVLDIVIICMYIHTYRSQSIALSQVIHCSCSVKLVHTIHTASNSLTRLTSNTLVNLSCPTESCNSRSRLAWLGMLSSMQTQCNLAMVQWHFSKSLSLRAGAFSYSGRGI